MQGFIRGVLASLLGLLIALVSPVHGEPADNVKWLVIYEGKTLPAASWTLQGGGAVRAGAADGVLRIVDNSKDDYCSYRATWQADPSSEIVVEARVRVASLVGWNGHDMLWPWRDGAPAGILVSDGRHQEGLVLRPKCVSTFMDRFYSMNTTDKFHVYRLVIRGEDMSVFVDGELKIRGKDAFWKPATESRPFLQFGSNSRRFEGESSWAYVKLGVRPAHPAARPKLKITLGQPWTIPPQGRARQTRPYLYNLGEGLLLMSVAQGPDAHYEPYGILKSTNEGKTWAPVQGLQEKTFAPQPMIRMKDGSILGMSRWMTHFRDGKGVHAGMTYHFDRNAESFQMFENKVVLPKNLEKVGACDRHIFTLDDSSIVAVIYDSHGAYMVRTTDQGRTWRFYSTIASGTAEEPSVTRVSGKLWTAVLRQTSMVGLQQVWSYDGAKTWGPRTVLEEGSVDADLITMNNGILACSYGRPGCSIMFSSNQGKTWDDHRVITEDVGFNYTAVREIRPGRLLYIHDAPRLTALYVDVKKVENTQ